MGPKAGDAGTIGFIAARFYEPVCVGVVYYKQMRESERETPLHLRTADLVTHVTHPDPRCASLLKVGDGKKTVFLPKGTRNLSFQGTTVRNLSQPRKPPRTVTTVLQYNQYNNLGTRGVGKPF